MILFSPEAVLPTCFSSTHSDVPTCPNSGLSSRRRKLHIVVTVATGHCIVVLPTLYIHRI